MSKIETTDVACYDGGWAGTRFEFFCPECDHSITLTSESSYGNKFNTPCECGYAWEVILKAVGTRKEKN